MDKKIFEELEKFKYLIGTDNLNKEIKNLEKIIDDTLKKEKRIKVMKKLLKIKTS